MAEAFVLDLPFLGIHNFSFEYRFFVAVMTIAGAIATFSHKYA